MIFYFPHEYPYKANMIKKRIEWSKINQDTRSPNCGSIYKVYYRPILKLISLITLPLPAHFSQRTDNWIVNHSKGVFWIRLSLTLSKLFHVVFRKPLSLEIKIVD